jgi:hypothetical protein
MIHATKVQQISETTKQFPIINVKKMLKDIIQILYYVS